MIRPELDESLRADLASCSALLGILFLRKPEADDAQAVIGELRCASMREWPFGSEADLADVEELVCGLSYEDEPSFIEALSHDYQRLFIGPFALAAPPWGSVYLDYESVICGCSTVKLQDWMRTHGLTVANDRNEPEDHIGLMFMLLSWLSSNRPELISDYLEKHFCTWAPHFCDLMQEKAQTPFYQGVAALARITLESIEEGLGLNVVEPKFYR
ncbi:MAG: Tat proofreading chaperone DmsD [Eggerthellaceae bacterium]|nr:Tat proofreading chaperone DmsD [Eggerthellaceae bacterium]